MGMIVAGVLSLGGFVSLAIVIVALVIGIWLDRTLGVKPLFTILLVVFSAPMSAFAVYRIAMSAIKKLPSGSSIQNQGDSKTNL